MGTKHEILNDTQWTYIKNIIGESRKSKHSLRTILDAILWINYTGSQWRNLDSFYPNWQTVYYHFRMFKLKGILEEILDCLVVYRRKQLDKEASPSVLAIDSQSVKTVQFVSLDIGIDGGKKIRGRKRTLLVDKLGLPFAIKVTGANISDNEAGIQALELIKGKVPRLKKIAADLGYKDTFVAYVEQFFKCVVEIAQKPESQQGFVPQKDRWQVERSFSWFNFKRRLFKDVEKTIESAEAMIQIAFISLLIKYL